MVAEGFRRSSRWFLLPSEYAANATSAFSLLCRAPVSVPKLDEPVYTPLQKRVPDEESQNDTQPLMVLGYYCLYTLITPQYAAEVCGAIASLRIVVHADRTQAG